MRPSSTVFIRTSPFIGTNSDRRSWSALQVNPKGSRLWLVRQHGGLAGSGQQTLTRPEGALLDETPHGGVELVQLVLPVNGPHPLRGRTGDEDCVMTTATFAGGWRRAGVGR
ncbi:hypothetical protein E1258_12540 [Micromonospora sp. KC207]|uniref:hypothetical protein n=1 Tax=Micromonospora sp. KC207 TaxID=2530377 RepID=UPI00104587F0|nr:hypothetical protein [Micromonospora sp. KC207]TDC61130.1 hypothetical protein E1258_12540 [Micromonospora sp. KC207]